MASGHRSPGHLEPATRHEPPVAPGESAQGELRPTSAHDVDSPALDALARLPPDDQELLRLLAWDGLSQAEAGLVLQISANAVAIRLYRARKRFGQELAKGSGPSRTLKGVEGQTSGHRNHGEPMP